MNDVRERFREGQASLVFPELEPVAPRPSDNGKSNGKSLVPSFERLKSKNLKKPSAEGRIRTTIMSFRTMHEHGDLLVNYLEARKSIFIDRLKWHVPQTEGLEFDQYDTPFCRWVVIHEYGEVLGGVRLLPTTANCGIYSYMLRDAQRGILIDIPTDVLFFEAPVEPRIWEASRFFVTEAVPAARRLLVQNLLFQQMANAAASQGATQILGIVPAVWSRWARRLHVGATPIGSKFSIDGTVSQSVLFSTTDQVI